MVNGLFGDFFNLAALKRAETCKKLPKVFFCKKNQLSFDQGYQSRAKNLA